MITLIDNYDSFTYNLVHYFGDLGVSATVYRNDEKTAAAVLKENPAAIVLSPGPCTPSEAGICLDLIKRNRGRIPILGVCLGHQAIGQAYGGKVVRAPQIMHGKLSAIHHDRKGLFDGLPDGYDATRYHSLIVEKASLPSCLEATAHTADGIIMALRHPSEPVYGVQFHPESIASAHGHALLANFLTLAGVAWQARRQDLALPQAPQPLKAA
jgi:anthranilate synthase component 2